MRAARRFVAAAALLACLAGSGGLAHAVTTKTIKYPCVDPAFTHLAITGPGVCGVQFNVTVGNSFTVDPVGSADLDIYFYEASGASGNLVGASTGGLPLTNCGNVTGTVPASATIAIVVLSPGCASNSSVTFTYSP